MFTSFISYVVLLFSLCKLSPQDSFCVQLPPRSLLRVISHFGGGGDLEEWSSAFHIALVQRVAFTIFFSDDESIVSNSFDKTPFDRALQAHILSFPHEFSHNAKCPFTHEIQLQQQQQQQGNYQEICLRLVCVCMCVVHLRKVTIKVSIMRIHLR